MQKSIWRCSMMVQFFVFGAVREVERKVTL